MEGPQKCYAFNKDGDEAGNCGINMDYIPCATRYYIRALILYTVYNTYYTLDIFLEYFCITQAFNFFFMLNVAY